MDSNVSEVIRMAERELKEPVSWPAAATCTPSRQNLITGTPARTRCTLTKNEPMAAHIRKWAREAEFERME